jgi:tRNA 2-thiouridine synthesizing protein A
MTRGGGEPLVVIDARGHRCPVPTLRLGRAVARAAPGAVLRLLSDDPLARIDAPHFAMRAGLEIVEVIASDDQVTVIVRKPA